MRILVTGATGSVGRLVVDELMGTDLGADVQVRALTANPGRAALLRDDLVGAALTLTGPQIDEFR